MSFLKKITIYEIIFIISIPLIFLFINYNNIILLMASLILFVYGAYNTDFFKRRFFSKTRSFGDDSKKSKELIEIINKMNIYKMKIVDEITLEVVKNVEKKGFIVEKNVVIKKELFSVLLDKNIGLEVMMPKSLLDLELMEKKLIHKKHFCEKIFLLIVDLGVIFEDGVDLSSYAQKIADLKKGDVAILIVDGDKNLLKDSPDYSGKGKIFGTNM